jgi:hypothetical protein
MVGHRATDREAADGASREKHGGLTERYILGEGSLNHKAHELRNDCIVRQGVGQLGSPTLVYTSTSRSIQRRN